MSETVRITFLTENEEREQKEIDVTHDSGMTLMTTLLQNKLISGNFCGGRGTCQRCRVRFLQAAPLPTSQDRQAFAPEELRLGYRLACMAKPGKDCIVQADFVKDRKLEIVTDISDVMNVSEKTDRFGQEKEAGKRFLAAVDLGTTTIAMQLIDMDSGQAADTYCAMNPQRSYGADVLSRIQAANEGIAQAASVNERMSNAAMSEEGTSGGAAVHVETRSRTTDDHAGAADIMRSSVWKVLQDGVSRFRHTCREKNPEADLCCMCIAGNTTMEHLLMGLSTEGLGKSPFLPVELGLQKCSLPAGDTAPLPVYIVPGISAFVGGDIVAGLYRLKMLPVRRAEACVDVELQNNTGIDSKGQNDIEDSRGVSLLIDLGTNGEMAMTDGKRMVVTAAAAGSAFEGGPGKTAVGSDMVAMTAFLLKEGIIDETGLMAEPYFEDGITVTVSGSRCSFEAFDGGRTDEAEETKELRGIQDVPEVSGPMVWKRLTDSVRPAVSVHLRQKDIRALQMAKAAVRAGVEVLYRKMGCPSINRIYLAGGFGYYLNVNAAIAIGLLPEEWKSCTKAVGNTSLAGAFQMGKDLWTGKLQEDVLSDMLQGIESINLAEQTEFEELYIGYMELKSS